MASNYIGEIRIFAGNFAPLHWAFCDGKTLPITGNEGLFAVLGTIYGGDGRTNFGLPDLRGRLAIGVGTANVAAGISSYALAQAGGQATVALTMATMPAHTHALNAATTAATTTDPQGMLLADPDDVLNAYVKYTAGAPAQQFGNNVIDYQGAGVPHDNIMPSLVMNYIIALEGQFPDFN